MTLDKYVSKGFTSSLGESSGKWVASSTASQAQNTYVPRPDSGTSFILGGGVSNPGRKVEGGKPFEFKDSSYQYNSDEVRNGGGTRSRDSIPSNCFGGGGSAGRGSFVDGQKALVGLFFALLVIGLAMVATGGFVSRDEKKKRILPGEEYSPKRSSSPLWYR